MEIFTTETVVYDKYPHMKILYSLQVNLTDSRSKYTRFHMQDILMRSPYCDDVPACSNIFMVKFKLSWQQFYVLLSVLRQMSAWIHENADEMKLLYVV